jgi:hypothetical protein
MAAELSSVDYAFLAILKVEDRELSNTEMDRLYQVRLKSRPFERLVAAEYIYSDTSRRPYRHTITAEGLKALNAELGIDEDWVEEGEKRSLRERQLWAGVVALQKQVILQNGPAATATKEKPADLDGRIRDAYGKLAETPGAWVDLTALRPLLGDVPKDEVDRALVRLLRSPEVRLDPEPFGHRVGPAERLAAVHVGGEARHKLAIGVQ